MQTETVTACRSILKWSREEIDHLDRLLGGDNAPPMTPVEAARFLIALDELHSELATARDQLERHAV